MTEFKVTEIYDTEMQITNQKVVIIELAEIEKTELLSGGYISTFGESKKFLIDINSPIFPQILAKAENEENISLNLSEFRFRKEIKNGISEEIAYHKTVYVMGLDKGEDFKKYCR
jgi:hypothetical protein